MRARRRHSSPPRSASSSPSSSRRLRCGRHRRDGHPLASAHAGRGERVLLHPPRLEEGYGINAESLRTLKAGGADTVISVDCGTTAVEEAKVARENRPDAHHHRSSHARAGAARGRCIVHPCVEPAYPNRDICGAGVAFKLAWPWRSRSVNPTRQPAVSRVPHQRHGLGRPGHHRRRGAAIGENRVIARHGLVGLAHCH